jgi:hypothetical protein
MKSWPENFAGIWDERQKHDVRRYERRYLAGDRVHLREWNPATQAHTGRWMEVRITFVTQPDTWDLPVHICVLSYEVVERHIADFAKAKYGDLG